MASLYVKAMYGAVELNVTVTPSTLVLTKQKFASHDVELDNQWPNDLYEIEIYVRTSFSLLSISPKNKITFGKVRSGSSKVFSSSLTASASAQGQTEEIETSAAFYDSTQRSGSGFVGLKHTLVTDPYNIDCL